ncbi:MAG: bifunctional molybdenum cofactor biosynthesis protein MoaC/MoaB [Ignavibacteriae bacterium]|nr:bifunctional molybdenum cofactor biosynthesis protein MoaC/MoaB [Ignavibacteriota bacterium]
MRDVSSKPNTLRTAKACAELICSPATIEAIKSGNVPKADPLGVARVAAIQAAKNTSLLIPYCHQVPLDFVNVDCELQSDSIRVTTEVKAVWKTGVEMEAVTAASAAALTLYDMLKIIDDSMEIRSVKLLNKKGGKSDYVAPEMQLVRAAVLVLSDSAAAGTRTDKSGKAIVERLESFGLTAIEYKILSDDQHELRQELLRLADTANVDLVFTTGGTGLSRRDTTPEATESILDRTLPGVSERLRSFGQERNRRAMLSRATAGVRGRTLIVNLPGSVNAVNESLDVLLPWLFHSFAMMKGGGHEERVGK